MIYTYRYDPNKTIEENAEESIKMDKLRATMGPTTEQLRKNAIEGLNRFNGHKPLDNRDLIC